MSETVAVLSAFVWMGSAGYCGRIVALKRRWEVGADPL